LHFTEAITERNKCSFVAKVNSDLRGHLLKSLSYALNASCITYFRNTCRAERIGKIMQVTCVLTSHFSKVTDEELQQVEDFVNIQEQLPLIERRNLFNKR
jgi:alanyl-tRNA synthetase